MSSIPPDCTVVTACFDLCKYNGKSLDHNTILDRLHVLLELPIYLVIYTDIGDHILEKRRELGLEDLTRIINMDVENMWSFQYIEKVRKNRELYHPTKDERTCAESHILCCNKFKFVLDTIIENPFNTTKFAWIDTFIGTKTNMKICEDYTPEKILHLLNNVTEKFHIQIINVNDKKYKLKENKREYYSSYKYVVAGSLFTCGKEIGVKILNRLNEIFIETTELGYGHGEEMFYLEVLDEFYDDIERSYGDYKQIINNFIKPTKNFYYIYHFIINNYLNLGYNRECYECCKKVFTELGSMNDFTDYNTYMQILYAYYVSSFYHKPEETVKICNKIYDIYNTKSYMVQQYNIPFDQLYQCNVFKPKYDVIFCIFGCATVDKYKQQIMKIEETWGKHAAKHTNMKLLYFLGEQPVDDMIDDTKYIYLKGVGDDYNSAAYKQTYGLQYIYENYDAEFVHCCGTDTFINIEKFSKYINDIKINNQCGLTKHFTVNTPFVGEDNWEYLTKLENLDNNKPLYIGGHGDYRQICDADYKHYYFHSGGPGFILNKKAMDKTYLHLRDMCSKWENIAYEKFHFACDVMISYYLHEIGGVEIIANENCFYSCNYKGWADDFCCCKEKMDIKNIIICHHMSLQDFDDYTSIIE